MNPEILSTPEAKRDQAWEKEFLQQFANSSLELVFDDAKSGPDGFPYLFVKTSEKGTEPAVSVIDWLATRGIGLVVNAEKQLPDYVFTYGMLWNFRERKDFLSSPIKSRSDRFELRPGQPLYHGDLSLEYFPEYARKLLREFFSQQGIFAARVLALSQDNEHFDICFSVESLGSPEPREYQGIAEAIAWFFPYNTSIVLVSEKDLPKFFNL